MRKLRFITGFLLALSAAPYSSAQQQVLPSHFGNWSGQPSPDSVETENYANLWKEAGRTPGEFNQYTSGAARINVDCRSTGIPAARTKCTRR